MSSLANRAEKFNKLYKVVRKHYEPVAPPANRTVLEHLVYACCLEDSSFEAADEVLAKLLEDYFDWNEVRVTTSLELAEMMKGLHDPLAAASRLRKVLHGLFESKYSFDAEFFKKENLGKAIEQLEKYKGISPFVIASVAQLSLGGHSIPVDQALLSLMFTIGAITEEEQKQGKIPGLERTIPKNKGVEFASLVHQLAVAFHANPQDKKVRDIILSIDSDAADRFPKRGGGRKKDEEPAEAPSQKPAAKAESKVEATAKGKKAAEPAQPAKPTEARKPGPEKPAPKPPALKAGAKKPEKPSGAKADAKPNGAKPPAPKKALPKLPAKKPGAKPPAKALARKKPR